MKKAKARVWLPDDEYKAAQLCADLWPCDSTKHSVGAIASERRAMGVPLWSGEDDPMVQATMRAGGNVVWLDTIEMLKP